MAHKLTVLDIEVQNTYAHRRRGALFDALKNLCPKELVVVHLQTAITQVIRPLRPPRSLDGRRRLLVSR